MKINTDGSASAGVLAVGYVILVGVVDESPRESAFSGAGKAD